MGAQAMLLLISPVPAEDDDTLNENKIMINVNSDQPKQPEEAVDQSTDNQLGGSMRPMPLFVNLTAIASLAVISLMSSPSVAWIKDERIKSQWQLLITQDDFTDETTHLLRSITRKYSNDDTPSIFGFECSKYVIRLAVRFRGMVTWRGDKQTILMRVNKEPAFRIRGDEIGDGWVVSSFTSVNHLKRWVSDHLTSERGIIKVRGNNGVHEFNQEFFMQGLVENLPEFYARCEATTLKRG